MIEDEKIIELFFEHSEQGIRELDIKYGKVCHKLSNNIVNNRQDAEECVNDTYLGAWNAIPPARPNPLLTYICKIVRNISLKIYYKKEAAKRSSHYTIAMEEIEACIADPNTVEAEIEARELARIIESFLDWTEKRDEYGNAQNFTVAYGEDESEYYYLTIGWVPNAIIRELTDNEDSTIAALPEEMRNDIIVMEITFENGKTTTKAITISLLDDGRFFASFDDYQISEEDTFINRPDSEAIGAAPVIEDNYKEADPNEPEQIVIPNSITFTGTIIDNVIESLVPIILVEVEENSGLSYDRVLFELTEEQKDWELKIGTCVQIVCSDIFQESTPPIGNLISITEAAPNDELKIADEAARAYYENTVFEVVSLEFKSLIAQSLYN